MRATRIRRDTSQGGSAIVILGFGTCHHLFGYFVGVPADRLFEPVGHFRVFLEEDLGILATLADADAVVAEPRPRFFDQSGLDAEIEHRAKIGRASSRERVCPYV